MVQEHRVKPMIKVIRALLITAVFLGAILFAPNRGVAEAPPAHSASGFIYVKTIDQAVCQTAYTGGFLATYFTRGECTRIEFNVTNSTSSSAVDVDFIDEGGTVFDTMSASYVSGTTFRVVYQSDASWPVGEITVRVTVQGDSGPAGSGSFFLNALGASVTAVAKNDGTPYAPGDAIPVSGQIDELNDIVGNTQKTGVPATYYLQARTPEGDIRGPYGPFTANSDGSFTANLPAAATAGLTAGPERNFTVIAAIDVIDVSNDNLLSGEWGAEKAGSGAVSLMVPPTELILENSFVSSVGWVKPGDTYPFRIFVKNFTDEDATNVTVTVPAPPSATFNQVNALNGAGTAVINGDGSITWSIGTLTAGNITPNIATLVVEAQADTLSQDPEVVWKDLSSTATLTYDGGPAGLTSETHGPKVIPPSGGFESARYGDKPFPMVPVDFRDRKHEAGHDGDTLARVVNSPDEPGSTFNLYQEMSFGQLYPFGSVPSAGVATADFTYEHGFEFSFPEPTTCRGTTLGPADLTWGTPAYPERINDGWYQLPGDTEYYGGDFPAFTLGVGSTIDSACGPIGKAVYDAAVIADPEIDYNQFDSDKDGVVDFFMMVFVGLGGNGDSQINGTPPYDNIWPHSSSLEFYFQDENGLAGYVSDDQLTDLTGAPQCWTGSDYSSFDTCASAGGTGQNSLPTFVRVGPYNVNPEEAIEKSSVIAHEYGHHLGLPDFYASYSAYNDLNLMAGDYSQHMTIFGKQEMGWVIPSFLQPGEQIVVNDWEEIKNDTGEITWQRPDGTFYTLSAANGDQNIHNGQAFGVKLPGRLVIDPEKVATQASAPYVWYSGRGNDFGCVPSGGRNLDIILPELADLPAGTEVKVNFKSSWDIEWDWDYGFVMVTTDGVDYTSLPSDLGYTTENAYNPNNAGCQSIHNNGITGQSGAYEQGPAVVTAARNPAANDYGNGNPFITDTYDLSAYAGEDNVVLRFSYYTDPAFDRPGWFIDDFEVTADGVVIYSTDFTEEDELRIFPGGCGDEGIMVADVCTNGWSRIKADATSNLDHGYYLELRDRAGFDFNGRGESDRGDLGWEPGALIEYTDEVRGYGNNGGAQPPNQHYLDSQPDFGLDCGDNLAEEDPPDVLTDPRCQDASFTATVGDNIFDDTDWIDNFHDESSDDGFWHFDYGCLRLEITSMAGHTGNSEALPADLTASAIITASDGCAEFDYGLGDLPENTPPTAVAEARPTTVDVGENIVFDGSDSFDAETAVENLTYEWDFDNDGTVDATGQTVNHSYSTAGTKTARLIVTDEGGLTAEDTITINVIDPNNAPNAENDSATVDNGAFVDIDVLDNDSDPDGDTLTVDSFTQPANGTVTQNGDGTLRYTHDGSATTADSFSYTISDGNGGTDTAMVNVTINEAGGGVPEGGGFVTGAGWLYTVEGERLNFFVRGRDNHPQQKEATLRVRDDAGGVRIDVPENSPIIAIGHVQEPCGGVQAGSNAIEYHASGTFNGTPATFRVCVEDNAQPGNDANNPDLFYMECIDGCSYNTGDRTQSLALDSGNIKIHQAPSGSASSNKVSAAKLSYSEVRMARNQAATASVLALDPLLLAEAPLGALQPLTVKAYGADGALLSGVEVSLVQTLADGSTQTFTAVTGLDGLALFQITIPLGSAEYVAYDGNLSSNAVKITAVP